MATKKILRRLKIKKSIRSKISGTPERPRLSVFKSNTAIVAQLVDDTKGHTLAYITSRSVSDAKSVNIELSRKVGSLLAEKAKESGIETVIFDRNGYLYHGKVKALAEGAREGGLKF
ncbi:50S ribosomal protein L18 [Rapidithrix thailandica]|uniref:Large ribosomal subunit protein uL18 n=1 Tax=Rapidithrix thailandica TaxID=413964 RepID=A0AAW9RNZ6_9BACT